MASCITSKWSGTASPQAELTVTLNASKSDGDTAVLDWVLKYVAHGYAANTSNAKSYTVTINGATVKAGTYDIDGIKNTTTIASGSVDVVKGTSEKNVSFSVSFAFNLTWSGVYTGTRTANGSISIPAKTKYTVAYNANGGTGEPSTQTKWFGTALTLSSTKPTRTGYSFQGWATSSGGSVAYASGASYTANSSATLYAVWKANTYTVTYNANGGTGGPTTQTKTYGVALPLSTSKPTMSKYNFKGWATSANGSVTYASGASYTANRAITLYAVWEIAYVKPKIGSINVYRCDANGTPSGNGTYAYASFTWQTSLAVSSITVEWSPGGKSVTVSASGTSGTATKIFGDGTLLTDTTYSITAVVADANGSTQRTATLSSNAFTIDYLAGGQGVAFGKDAEKSTYLDSAWRILARDGFEVPNNKVIYGQETGGSRKEAFNPVNESNNTVLGWGNYNLKSGNTNVYGHDVHIGVSNCDAPTTYRPYLRKGDTLTVSLKTAGYVTNGGKDVSFWVPLAVPVVGNPTVTAASNKGFVLRQGGKYTHGSGPNSGDEVRLEPNAYTVSATGKCGISITASFPITTDVTNNDAIGIYWSGIITFS
jgi:uncharacterized repeat protein (TIGR02543 family)